MSPDANFYHTPYFFEHIDSNAVSIMTRYLSSTNTKDGDGDVIKNGGIILDFRTILIFLPLLIWSYEEKVGLGMNKEEMKGNNI